jgi:hypothetical protein
LSCGRIISSATAPINTASITKAHVFRAFSATSGTYVNTPINYSLNRKHNPTRRVVIASAIFNSTLLYCQTLSVLCPPTALDIMIKAALPKAEGSIKISKCMLRNIY